MHPERPECLVGDEDDAAAIGEMSDGDDEAFSELCTVSCWAPGLSKAAGMAKDVTGPVPAVVAATSNFAPAVSSRALW